ncbi:MocR-like transcription factor YczR [Gordonia sp. (in: high G+C Gram-positive bacteria)]|uniref:MocR-like transcription factor YczR n=1 Tax=Gordonia sp. (in: high G+C Gram-positive bacteria) TaxID=84139 RepID=UPI003F9D85CC
MAISRSELTPTGAIGAHALARRLGPWRPAGPRPAYAALADAVRVLLLDGRVSVGTAVPSERSLAEVLDVSRTTVAGAYAALRDTGHLQSRQGARSVLVLPVDMPAEPFDHGDEADVCRLNIAAPSAPDQVVHDAFRYALECAPAYLSGAGVYPSGLRVLTEVVARRYSERGLPTRPEQILVTAGAQHALRVVLDTLVSPGESVVVEQPTYSGTLQALARHRARVVALPLDTSHGWDLDHLESILRLQRPALVCMNPDFHNPTGLLLAADGRRRLGELSARYGVPIVIDETVVELGLDRAAPAPVAAFASRRAQVITIGSVSKTVWSGLRVGWIRTEAPPDPFAVARYDLGISGSVMDQLAAAYAVDELASFLPGRLDTLRAQRAVALDALGDALPDAVITPGGGGLCLWVRLPRPAATATAAAAVGLGVRLTPGSGFAPDGGLENYIRIPYTLGSDELRRGIDLVGRAYRQAIGSGAEPGEDETGLPGRLAV